MITALTGLPASGKSTVREMFAELGYTVIDADKLAHQELEKIRPELATLFGVPDDGKPVDRKALARVVFGDMEQLDFWSASFIRESLQE